MRVLRLRPLPLAVHAQPPAGGWLRAGRATASRRAARAAAAVRLLPALGQRHAAAAARVAQRADKAQGLCCLVALLRRCVQLLFLRSRALRRHGVVLLLARGRGGQKLLTRSPPRLRVRVDGTQIGSTPSTPPALWRARGALAGLLTRASYPRTPAPPARS